MKKTKQNKGITDKLYEATVLPENGANVVLSERSHNNLRLKQMSASSQITEAMFK